MFSRNSKETWEGFALMLAMISFSAAAFLALPSLGAEGAVSKPKDTTSEHQFIKEAERNPSAGEYADKTPSRNNEPHEESVKELLRRVEKLEKRMDDRYTHLSKKVAKEQSLQTQQSEEEDEVVEDRPHSRQKRNTNVQIWSNESKDWNRGRDGRDGSAGLQGLQGQQGPPGKHGQKGEAGASGSPGPPGSSGVSYIRWGRTTCPTGAELVYSGRIGGEYYNHIGGGSDYVCLPNNPLYGKHKDGTNSGGHMHGAEYQVAGFNPFTEQNLHDHEAVCAVCYVKSRGTQIMIPARNVCSAGWSREYHGYLMTAHRGHNKPNPYICVDVDAEYVPGTKADKDGALLYPVEGECSHSLPCMPYVNGWELTCAVCTK